MIEKKILKNIKTSEIKPYEKNYLNHKKNIKYIKNSLQSFGYIKPSIVIDENNVLLCGHGTLQAIQELQWQEIPEVVQIIGLTEQQKSAYRIADNSSANDVEINLENLQYELDLIGESYNVENFGFNLEDLEDKTKYTRKIEKPVYTPTGEKPKLNELVNEKRVLELSEKIKNSNIPENIKDFLLKAATRFYVFNYSKIAEFYAQSDKNIQELFEDLALVIIDFDKAIENGFIILTKKILEQYKNEYK